MRRLKEGTRKEHLQDHLKQIPIWKIANLHKDLHKNDGNPYSDIDRIWVIKTIHDLLALYLDIELCWADCVWYAHEDSDMSVEDIGLCKNCGYCKPPQDPQQQEAET